MPDRCKNVIVYSSQLYKIEILFIIHFKWCSLELQCTEHKSLIRWSEKHWQLNNTSEWRESDAEKKIICYLLIWFITLFNFFSFFSSISERNDFHTAAYNVVSVGWIFVFIGVEFWFNRKQMSKNKRANKRSRNRNGKSKCINFKEASGGEFFLSFFFWNSLVYFNLYERKPSLGASVQFTRRAHKIHNFRTITVDEAKHTERASCVEWIDKQRYSKERSKRTRTKKKQVYEPNEKCSTVDENESDDSNLRKTERTRATWLEVMICAYMCWRIFSFVK